MDITKILAELRQEQSQIQDAIATLERLAAGRGRRRGRPPAWLARTVGQPAPPRHRKKPATASMTKLVRMG